MRGTDRNYSRQLKNGKVKILSEWSHGGIAQGLKAAQLGAPRSVQQADAGIGHHEIQPLYQDDAKSHEG